MLQKLSDHLTLLAQLTSTLTAAGLNVASLSETDKRKLDADIDFELNGLKNAAFTRGFISGQEAVKAYIEGKYQ